MLAVLNRLHRPILVGCICIRPDKYHLKIKFWECQKANFIESASWLKLMEKIKAEKINLFGVQLTLLLLTLNSVLISDSFMLLRLCLVQSFISEVSLEVMRIQKCF
jgi:hypothetical protein